MHGMSILLQRAPCALPDFYLFEKNARRDSSEAHAALRARLLLAVPRDEYGEGGEQPADTGLEHVRCVPGVWTLVRELERCGGKHQAQKHDRSDSNVRILAAYASNCVTSGEDGQKLDLPCESYAWRVVDLWQTHGSSIHSRDIA